MQRLILVVDTQRDFMAADGALSVAGAEALSGPMQALLDGLKPEETAAVLFTFDTHEPALYATSPEAEAFPIHCVRGSAGWENCLDPVGIDPAIPVWRIEKGVFDMWAQPGLTIEPYGRTEAAPVEREAFFGALKAVGVREAVVIGVAADYCVRWAIGGLLERGFAVTVPADLTRGIDRPIAMVAEEDFPGAALRIVADSTTI